MKHHGIKRLLACIMAAILLLQPMGACASDLKIADTLKFFALVTDTNLKVEFTSTTTSRSLTLQEGDYVEILPIHKVNPKYLSYNLQSVQCSDPSVVGVSFERTSEGQLGLKLHALLEGEADISATYNTYRTQFGMKYEDWRGNSTFTQLIHVTVESSGTVDVKVNISGGKYSSVKGVTLSMVRMKDTLSEVEQQKIHQYLAETMADYVSAGESSAVGVFVSGVEDAVIDVSAPTSSKGIKLFKNVAGKVLGFIQGLYQTAVQINHAYVYAKYASMRVPVFAPRQLELSVTVTNNTRHVLENLSVQVTPDRYLSFNGITGPWEVSKSLGNGYQLDPEKSMTLSVPVYPRFVYGTLSSEGEKVKAYTSSIVAQVQYTDSRTGDSKSVSKKTSLDAYTTITQERLNAYKQTLLQEYRAQNVDAFTSSLLGGAFNGYERWFGYTCFSQVFVLACPVEAVIQSAKGEELAVLAQPGDIYAGEGITGFVQGEEKYIIVDNSMLDQYRIAARATNSGSMDVLTYAYHAEKGMSIKAYQALPLEKGAQFAFQTNEAEAADLGAVAASGEVTRLDADAALSQQELVASLAAQGMSSEESNAYVNLLVRQVIPDHLMEEMTDAIRPDDFCTMVLRMAEQFFGVSLADAQEENIPVLQQAVNAGLLTAQQAQEMEKESLTMKDAAVLADRLLQMAGILDDASLEVYWAPEDMVKISPDGEEAETTEAPDAQETAEAEKSPWLCQRLKLTEDVAEESLVTVGQAVLLLDRLRSYTETAMATDELVKRICEDYTNSMTWSTKYAAVCLYATDPEASGELHLQNFAYWHPGMGEYIALYEHMISIVAQTTNYYDYIINGGQTNENDPLILPSKNHSIHIDDELTGVFMDDDGTVYRWMPICYTDKNGEIYQDAMYLVLAKVREGAANEFIRTYNSEATGDCTMECILIADQDMVAAFLGQATQAVKSSGIMQDWVLRHDSEASRQSAAEELLRREAYPAYRLPENDRQDSVQ